MSCKHDNVEMVTKGRTGAEAILELKCLSCGRVVTPKEVEEANSTCKCKCCCCR